MQTAPILNTWVRCTSGNVFNLPIIIPIMCSHVLHHNHHDDHHQHHHHHDRHDHRRSCSASPTPCHPSWQLRRRATLRWFKRIQTPTIQLPGRLRWPPLLLLSSAGGALARPDHHPGHHAHPSLHPPLLYPPLQVTLLLDKGDQDLLTICINSSMKI